MRSHLSFGPADMFIHSLKERKKKSSTPRFRQFDNIPSLEKPCLEERTKAFELELTGRALGTRWALLGLGNTELSKGLHLGKMEQYLLMHSDDTPQLVPFLFEVGQRRDWGQIWRCNPLGAVGQRVYPFRSWRDVQNVSEMKSSFLLVNTPIWHVDTIDGCIAGMISGMQQQTLQLPDICLVCQQCKIEFSLQSIQTRVKPWKLIHCMSKIQIKIVIFRV